MKCFLVYIRQQFHALMLYRFDFFIRILYGLISMYGVCCLWNALYRQNPSLTEHNLSTLITYAMLAMALDIVFYPAGDNSVDKHMNHLVRKGNIDTQLLRPLDFQLQMLYRNASYVLLSFCLLVIPACTAGILFMGMEPPVSLFHAIAFSVSLILGYFILFSFNFLLGLLSMVTYNIKQITWAYRGLVGLLSGKLVPLWVFPANLQTILNALPFRCIFAIPLNIYTVSLSKADLTAQLMFQFGWALLLFLLGHTAWLAVRRKLTVQGG